MSGKTCKLLFVVSGFVFTLLCMLGVPEAECDVVFTKDDNNPLISAGFSGGAFDVVGVRFTEIIFDNDVSIYKMWYTGYSGSPSRGQIGYATSVDGYTWVPYQTDPVIGFGFTGEYDDWQASRPVVLKDGDTYRMWYSGDSYGHYWTCYATSSDGINWTSHGMIIDWTAVFGSNEGWARFAAPTTVHLEDGLYKMWYYTACCGNSGVGYATSTDCVDWTIHGEVMDTGSGGEWDDFFTYHPCVVKSGFDYLMFYTGSSTDEIQRIGFATSPDGIAWTKYDNNPVLDVGS